jgi:hypothetical protein
MVGRMIHFDDEVVDLARPGKERFLEGKTN